MLHGIIYFWIERRKEEKGSGESLSPGDFFPYGEMPDFRRGDGLGPVKRARENFCHLPISQFLHGPFSSQKSTSIFLPDQSI
jgi:hypothetical protein